MRGTVTFSYIYFHGVFQARDYSFLFPLLVYREILGFWRELHFRKYKLLSALCFVLQPVLYLSHSSSNVLTQL